MRAYFRHIRPDLEAGEQALVAIEFLAKPMRGRGANPVMTAAHQVATPANWQPGDDVIITAAVSDEEAAQRFPGYQTIKPYLRTTAQPA